MATIHARTCCLQSTDFTDVDTYELLVKSSLLISLDTYRGLTRIFWGGGEGEAEQYKADTVQWEKLKYKIHTVTCHVIINTLSFSPTYIHNYAVFIPSQANFSSNTGGSCEYDNLMCDTKCESEIKKITNLTIAISVLCALFLLLTCTLSISIIIISCSIFKKRHANRNLQPERDGNGINDGDHHDHEAPAGEPRQNENDPLVAQGDN